MEYLCRRKRKSEARKMEIKLNNVCAFGDSVMKGIVADKDNSTERGLKYRISEMGFAERCRRSLNIGIENFARFGGIVSQGTKLVERYKERIRECDFTLFEFGGNDCDYDWSAIAERPSDEHKPKTPMKQFIETYSSMIDTVKSLGSTPVLLSLPVLDPERFFNYVTHGLSKSNVLKWLGGTVLSIDRWHEMYNMAVFRLGAMQRVPVIDITSVFLERKNYRDYICDDGIHPNERGHELIECAIMDFLQERRVILQ